MKIIHLIKSEFLKNYSWKKLCIITLVLLISSIVLVELNDLFINAKNGTNYGDNFEYVQSEYNRLLNQKNKTLEDKFNLYSFKVRKEIIQYIEDKKVSSRDWKSEILHYKFPIILEDNYAINLYREHKNDDVIQSICKVDKNFYDNIFEGSMSHYCDKMDEELEELYQSNQKEIATYSYLLKEDKFYLYVQYLKDIGYIQDENELELANLIIDEKIENMEDFRALNYKQYPYVYDELLKEEYFRGSSESQWFSTYQDYVRYNKKLIKDTKEQQAIILYSTKHNIKHDLVYDKSYSYGDRLYDYITGKTAVNLIFHLSLIVILLVSVTSGGIISKEHSTGTIKNLITAPIERWKILLSKFIYLILHTYIIWLIGLVVLSLYAGIKYGISDLISPKLVYWNGKVVEINYYLYLLKDMFLASIPLIAFLSMLFFLSAVTLNTSVTTSVTSIFGILPLLLWYLCSNVGSVFLVFTKTPFLYFDCGFLFGKQEFYMNLLKKVDIRLEQGIIVSLITVVVFYALTNYIYIKRDIKN